MVKPWLQKLVLILTFIFITMFAVALYVKQDAIYEQLKVWKLVPLPETFTELYFEDHLKLPTRIIPEEEQTFKFTVHNLEYTDMEYPYTVKATGADGYQQVLQTGTFVLIHDAYITKKITYSIGENHDRVKVEVNLVNKKQTIHFWLNGVKE
ncbi:MAG: hypothetical protein WC775_02140 [Patescibacteria group bacterium]|jgi:hypothetical protein